MAQRRARVTLGRGAVQRSDSPVIGGESAFHFLRQPHRGSDDESVGHHPASAHREDVVAAEMDTGGASEEGDVDPVVHEERHRQGLHQSSCQGQEFDVRGLLEAELHRGHATGHGGQRDGHWIAGAEEGVVGDEQETEGGG